MQGPKNNLQTVQMALNDSRRRIKRNDSSFKKKKKFKFYGQMVACSVLCDSPVRTRQNE